MKNLKIWLIALLMVLVLPVPVLAADAGSEKGGSVVEAIHDLRDHLIDWFNDAVNFHIQEIYQPNPVQPAAVAVNQVIPTLALSIHDKIDEELMPIVKISLEGPGTDFESSVAQLYRVLQNDSGFTGSSGQTGTNPANKGFNRGRGQQARGGAFAWQGGQSANQNQQQEQYDPDNTYNFGAFISPNVYAGEKAKTGAKNYLKFLAFSVQPLTSIDMNSLTAIQKNQLTTTMSGQAFLIYQRALATQLSVAMDNLMGIYAKRIRVGGNGYECRYETKRCEPCRNCGLCGHPSR